MFLPLGSRCDSLYKLFRKPPVILKIVRKSPIKRTLETISNDSVGKPERKSDVAFGTIFRISNYYLLKQAGTLLFYFSRCSMKI